jgi:hypothetical protein
MIKYLNWKKKSLEINFNISDEELQYQIALGTLDPQYLQPRFIMDRKDPDSLAALVDLWGKTGMTRKQTLEIADTLIIHPFIREVDRQRVVNLRNSYLFTYTLINNIISNM